VLRLAVAVPIVASVHLLALLRRLAR